jgi:DNA primase
MSSKIPQTFIDEVLQRSAIVPVISTYVKLKAFGNNYKANCPFHHEKTPSFSINPSKQFYHCFGCGASGNVITFLMQYKQMDFREAVAYLAQECGMPMPTLTQEDPDKKERFEAAYALCKTVAQRYEKAFTQHRVAQEYMAKRGIKPAILSQFQIGYSTDAWDTLVKALPQQQALLAELGIITKGKQHYYDRFRNRVMFPIQNEKGAYVGFGARTITDEMPKYLNSSDAFIFKKGFELYGLYQALQSKKRVEHIIVVEGYMDVIGLHNHQVKNVVASLGTAITKQQIQKILRHCDKITFCFDGDKAGKKAAWKALLTAMPLMHKGAFVKFVFLPEGEDPDSFIQQHGKAAFAQYFSRAQDLPDYFFTQMQSSYAGQDISSKAQFIEACAEIIDTVPQSIFRSLLEERLQQIAGFSVPQQAPHSPPPPAGRPKRPAGTNNTLSRLIGLCIQHPVVISQIRAQMPDDEALQALSPTLLDLCHWVDQYPQGTTGQLLEHFRSHPHGARISALAAQDWLLSEDSYADEAFALLERLQSQTQQNVINRLLSKSKIATLNAAEKQQLQQLLTQQKMPG